MNAKQKKKEWLIKRGFLKPETTFLKRTESGQRFQYPSKLEISFVKFSSEQRDKNKQPLFSDFYSSLPTEQQNQITITNIYNYEKFSQRLY